MDAIIMLFAFMAVIVNGATYETEHYYIDTNALPYNGDDAFINGNEYCQDTYGTKLATICDPSLHQELENQLATMSQVYAFWIGLYLDANNEWRWTQDDSSLGDFNAWSTGSNSPRYSSGNICTFWYPPQTNAGTQWEGWVDWNCGENTALIICNKHASLTCNGGDTIFEEVDICNSGRDINGKYEEIGNDGNDNPVGYCYDGDSNGYKSYRLNTPHSGDAVMECWDTIPVANGGPGCTIFHEDGYRAYCEGVTDPKQCSNQWIIADYDATNNCGRDDDFCPDTDMITYQCNCGDYQSGKDGSPFCEGERDWITRTGEFVFSGNYDATTDTDDCCASSTMLATDNNVALIEVNHNVEVGNIAVEFSVTVPTTNGATNAGIFLRTIFPGNDGISNLKGYYFGINVAAKTYNLGRYDDDNDIANNIAIVGKSDEPVTAEINGAVVFDTKIIMKLTMNGDQITGYINDAVQDSITDNTYSIGSAGFLTVDGFATFCDLMPSENGHLIESEYVIIDEEVVVGTAEQACQDRYGTHAASVHTQDAFDSVYGICESLPTLFDNPPRSICCLGGDDTSGEWIWSDGSDNSFIKDTAMTWNDGGLWADGQPNEGAGEDWSCVATNTDHWTYGMHDCVTTHNCYAICDAPSCIIDVGTFNWYDLTEHGDGIPRFNYDMNVEKQDLSLNIRVELEYLGSTSVDDKEALWGTTYVLDFESFDSHKSAIYSPGSCQNRRASDFYDGNGVLKDFSEWWRYSEYPMGNNHIGEPGDYLAYPPTDTDKWQISLGEGDSCGYIVYQGHFTWNELRGCNDGSDGAISYTLVDQDANWLNLTGTFSINIISPFDYNENFDYYRVYQILSQPFVIAVSKTIYVLGSAGINLLTMSIIAVYKQDVTNTFRLIILTECSDYLRLYRTSSDLAGFTGSTGLNAGDFIAVTTSVTDTERLANTPSGCLNNKDYLCSQLWEIRAENVNCNKNPNGIDFSGKYTLQFNTECRSDPDITADLATYCNSWLPAHDEIANGVLLETNLVWKDEICDPKVFKEQFQASMKFYIDDKFENEVEEDQLYQVGEDQIYIEITTHFDTTFSIFDTTLMNVWICTFDPLYYDEVSDPDPNEFNGGCYDENRDGGLIEGDGNKYFYHIYQESDGRKEEGFELIGHPDDTNDNKNKLRFYFTVPHKIARDRLYIHAQIEVSLTELNKTGLSHNTATSTSVANQIDHFIHFVDIGDDTKPKEQPIGDNNNKYEPPQQPFNYNPPQQIPINPVINTPITTTLSPWILIIGAFLAMILIFNIALLCYMKFFKTKRQRNRVSFNSRRRSGYSSVKHIDDSEYDQINNVNA